MAVVHLVDGPGHWAEAYLHLDFLPVLICDVTATLLIQLLKNASVYGQAVIDF
jgi:hypothetical protein